MKRKKIVIHSCFSRTATGFGKNAKTLLSYLSSLDKYDIVEYATAPRTWNDAYSKLMPWKLRGVLPNDPKELQQLYSDPNRIRPIQYGSYYIDRIIKEEKPDLYLGIEDIWAFSGYWDKPWWNKFPCAIWTTLDSLPIINIAHKNAHKIKNYWVWADFARKALHDLGHTHVQTVHGVIDTSQFYPIKDIQKIRHAAKISDDTVIFGFVFRNQLRKLVGTLIEGFAIFKKQNPQIKAKLLLHTFWDESSGWRIPEFLKEFNVPNEDILTTYICTNCKKIQLKNYSGQGLDCPNCGAKKAQFNPHVDLGCEDHDLNLIYNLMDAYVHPMTSGGLEIPLLEASLAGLPIATVPYSSGLEFTENKHIYALNYHEYREINSQFIKAQPDPYDIAKYMRKICSLPFAKRKEIGQEIRAWALEKFDNTKTFKFLEDFIDSLPKNTYDFKFEKERRDESYPLKDIESNFEWLQDLYKGCLRMDEDEQSDGMKHWLHALEIGATRQQIHDYFIQTAKKENSENQKFNIEDYIIDSDKKRLVYIMPQSLGDCFISTAILKSLRELYPTNEWDYYVCTMPQYNVMFEHLDFIKGFIPYLPNMDNYAWWEGAGRHKGYCDIVFQPYILTQRVSSYNHNGLDKCNLQMFKNGELDPEFNKVFKINE